MSFLSVLIPTRDRPDYFASALNSLIDPLNAEDIEIIIQDNIRMLNIIKHQEICQCLKIGLKVCLIVEVNSF